MCQNQNSIDTIMDPKFLVEDKEDSFLHLENLLSYLFELDKIRPSKKYAQIFYERYVKNLSLEAIEENCNLTSVELNSRLLEIANYITRKIDKPQ